jgi:hypothetical protein
MREEIAALDDERFTFTGEFERLGTKRYNGQIEWTVLLLNIKNHEGQLLTDHLWFNLTKELEAILPQVKEKTLIEFLARPKQYQKGYENMDIDFKLAWPTKFRVVSGGRF